MGEHRGLGEKYEQEFCQFCKKHLMVCECGQPSTGAYTPPLRFADGRRGEAALDLVSGELWVCFRHPDGQFVTERKATALDLQAVADLLNEARTRIATLEEQLVNVPYWDAIGADRLAREVKALVDRGVIDSRSPAGDAWLDYEEGRKERRALGKGETDG